MFKKALWQGLTLVFAFLLCFAVTVATLLATYSSAVDSALRTTSWALESVDDGTLYSAFTPDKKYLNEDGTGNSDALIRDAIDIGRRFGAEGSVLLKNENNALPLAKGSKVTLLGARSETPIINAGMGQHSLGPYISLKQALADDKTDFAHTSVDSTKIKEINFSELKYGGDGAAAGAGFEVNPVVFEKYAELNKASGIQLQPKAINNNFDPLEPARSDVEPALNSSYTAYADAAIVVIGRGSGEGADYLPGAVKEGLGFEEPLQLSKNERDAIEMAKEKFDKVIVLVGTNSAMEIDALKHDDKVDAILWIGHPGNYGFLGVADILCGNVSPSGGLYDIYAASNLSAPAMMNMGDYSYANSDKITRKYRNQLTNKYVIEAEGIYVGYRYYETRYYDSVVNPSSKANSSAGATQSPTWDYDKEVSYGFGYGLTYTDFTYEITNMQFDYASAKTGKITGHDIYVDFTVKVTNTGDRAGKANVQIYGQAPYIKGGLEKSAIQLLDFDKTPLIAPKSSETITIKVDLQNIASYDNTYANADGSTGTYVLDEGDYYFAVGNGAHDALNNIMKAQGHTPDDANANAALARKWSYDYSGPGNVDAATFSVSKNNTRVKNQIDYADWNHFEKDKVTYLSRADWEGTYPKEYNDMSIPDNMLDLINGKYYTVKTNQDTSSIKWGSKETDWKFYEMAFADFDDIRWDEILSQLTIEESMVLAAFGGDAIPSVPSVGLMEMQGTENMGNGIVYTLSATKDPSAPWAIKSSDPNADWNGEVFGSAPLMASTFNPALLYEEGVFVGTEGLFLGVPILWGPGLNTHRHAYNGRNSDYYSEDPVLSGVMAMEFAIGALDKGLIAAPKHFAFNDQETNRFWIAPFMTEQRAREVELRAFQIALEAGKYDRIRKTDTGMQGLMTSFSKIGPVECTCSYELQTGICVNEWGFHGYAVTDIYDDTDLYSAMVYSGSTGYDVRGWTNLKYEDLQGRDTSGNANRTLPKIQNDGTTITKELYANDADFQHALKASNKRILWVLAQSSVMNRYNSTTHRVRLMTWWRATYISFIVLFSVLTAGAAAMYVLSTIKNKKETEI